MPTPEWQDRRALFSKGREVHDPSIPAGRRMSDSSITDALTKTTSNTSSVQSPIAASKPAGTGAAAGSPYSQRRRSSAASNTGSGMFGNLMGLKRGSDDYNQRRGSIEEMEGKSSVFGGMWNSTFRGMEKKTQDMAKEAKRGVME